MELREQKNILRRQLLEQAAGLEQAYCRRADREITSRLFLLPEYKKAEVLFCFVGTEREIDTRPLILDALKLGKRVGVPKCTGNGGEGDKRALESGTGEVRYHGAGRWLPSYCA